MAPSCRDWLMDNLAILQSPWQNPTSKFHWIAKQFPNGEENNAVEEQCSVQTVYQMSMEMKLPRRYCFQKRHCLNDLKSE